jgi:hypothetical protein
MQGYEPFEHDGIVHHPRQVERPCLSLEPSALASQFVTLLLADARQVLVEGGRQ